MSTDRIKLNQPGDCNLGISDGYLTFFHRNSLATLANRGMRTPFWRQDAHEGVIEGGN
jgi:hypothetical protein